MKTIHGDKHRFLSPDANDPSDGAAIESSLNYPFKRAFFGLSRTAPERPSEVMLLIGSGGVFSAALSQS
jgi:hypothetical protein